MNVNTVKSKLYRTSKLIHMNKKKMSKRKQKESIIRYVLLNYKTIYIVKMHFVIFFRTLNSIEINWILCLQSLQMQIEKSKSYTLTHTHNHKTNKHKRWTIECASKLNNHFTLQFEFNIPQIDIYRLCCWCVFIF